jgi:ferredoxin
LVKVEVYYFSGTGNSLAIARDIARKIKGELISISSLMSKKSINTDADIIGIVFPVYHGGFPLIIKNFVCKMTGFDNKYIFAVCTYGDSPGLSMKYFAKTMKSSGGKLSAGFAVKMPYNYITPSFVLSGFLKSFTLREIDFEKQQVIFTQWKRKLEEICEYINAQKECEFETGAEIITNIVDFLNIKETIGKSVWLKIGGFEGKTDLPFIESRQLMDYSFNCDNKCNGCGICTKVCPVKNINLIDERPVWQHHCEQCFACLQWCPKEAIQFGHKTSHGRRYHHPDVMLPDMIIYDN